MLRTGQLAPRMVFSMELRKNTSKRSRPLAGLDCARAAKAQSKVVWDLSDEAVGPKWGAGVNCDVYQERLLASPNYRQPRFARALRASVTSTNGT
jgi:hypothetical protein